MRFPFFIWEAEAFRIFFTAKGGKRFLLNQSFKRLQNATDN